jgi:hypothetical protein
MQRLLLRELLRAAVHERTRDGGVLALTLSGKVRG